MRGGATESGEVFKGAPAIRTAIPVHSLQLLVCSLTSNHQEHMVPKEAHHEPKRDEAVYCEQKRDGAPGSQHSPKCIHTGFSLVLEFFGDGDHVHNRHYLNEYYLDTQKKVENAKRAIIPLAHTCTDPGTMMVKHLDTVVAYTTMNSARRSVDLACLTEF